MRLKVFRPKIECPRGLKPLAWGILLLFLYHPSFAQWATVQEVNSPQKITNLIEEQVGFSRNFLGKVSSSTDSSIFHTFQFYPTPSEPFSILYGPALEWSKGTTVQFTQTIETKFFPSFIPIEGERIVQRANFAISQLDNESGLKSNNISAVAFSEGADIWVGYTNGGVSCIRGKNIYHVSQKQGLENDQVSALIFHEGSLWIGTFGGGLYQLKHNTLTRYHIENGFPSNHILNFGSVGDELWIGVFNDGLIRFKEGKFTHFAKEKGYPATITSMATDTSTQTLYLTEEKGSLFLLSPKLGLSSILFPQSPSLPFHSVSAENGKMTALSPDGTLLHLENGKATKSRPPAKGQFEIVHIASSGNIWLSDAEGNAWSGFRGGFSKITRNQGLSHAPASFITQDPQKNIWYCTGQDGIYILSPTNFRTLLTKDSPTFSAAARPHAIDSFLVLCTASGLGVMQSDYSLRLYQHPALQAPREAVQWGKKIWVVQYDGLYEISSDSLFRYSNTSPDPTGWNNMTGISVSNDGKRLLLAMYNYGMMEFNPTSQTFRKTAPNVGFTYINHLFQDTKGRIWLSSLKSGIAYQTSKERVLLAEGNGETTDHTEDGEGTIWIGTSEGLFSFDTTGKLERHFFPSADFSNDIRSLIWDAKRNCLWAGTAAGLIQYTPSDGKAMVFGNRYGINGSFFSRAAATLWEDRVIWATNHGWVEYNHFRIRPSDQKPLISLSRILFDYQQAKWEDFGEENDIQFQSMDGEVPQGLSLPFSVKVISLQFSSNYWGRDQKMALYYRLAPDTTWVGPVSDMELVLAGLRPQPHKLEVKALTNVGRESEIFTFEFEIRRPFYLQIWFVTTLVAILLAAVWYGLRRSFRISLENIKSYSNRDEFITRTRILGFLQLVVLPISAITENSMGVQGYDTFPLILLIVVSLMGAVLLFSTFITGISLQNLRYLALFCAELATFFTLHLGAISDYAPTFTIGYIVVMVFCAILFDNLKMFMIYLGIALATVLYYIYWLDLSNPNHLLFLSNFALGYIFGATFHILQVNKISTILFSDKIVNAYDKFVIVCDQEARVVYCNKHVLDTFQVQEEAVLGLGWFKMLGYSGEKLDRVRSNIKERFFDLSKNDHFETRILLPNSQEHQQIEWQDMFLEGKFIMAIGTNVTELRKQESQIRLLSLIASNTENLVIITSAAGEIEWVNQSFMRVTGYAMEEVLGQKPGHLLQGKESSQETIAQIRDSIQKGIGFTGEILNYTKAGKPYWISLDIQPIRNGLGKVEKFVAIEMEITEKKLLERKLKEAAEESELKYTLISENTSDGVAILDGKGNFIYASPTYRKILGYPEDHPASASYENQMLAVHPDDRAALDHQVMENIKNRADQALYTFRIQHFDGHYIWREDSSTYFYDDRNRFIKAYIIARDVSQRVSKEKEREKLIEELSRSYKELKQFSYITQHNLRAPVANFIGLLNLLEAEVAAGMQQQLVHNLQKTASTFDQTIQDLNLILSIKDNPSVERVWIRPDYALERALASLGHLTQGITAEIITDFKKEPQIYFNQEYLESTLTQLLSNSFKFRSADRPLEIEISTYRKGDTQFMTYKDNGIGLDLQLHRGRIFGLYQRFHPHIEGKGLGLYLIKAQVEAIRGKISVSGAVDQGLTFTIEFPPAD